jgi:NAD(P)-dependent dehydrogenase (short-subunit alcohol dehydrogenase family)
MRVLITGAAKGLGAAIAKRLAGEGTTLLLHTRTSSLEEVATTCRERGSEVELLQGEPASLQVDALVNNAGAYLTKPLLETSSSEWQLLMETNFFTPLRFMRAAGPSLIEARGAIVNIGSVGVGRPHRRSPAYQVSKESLWALTQAFAASLAEQGVRVNLIAPGQMENSVDERTVPFGRPATLDEVADLVAYLLSEKGSYITGQAIGIAGGLGI